jgi:hypothetical protein
MYGRSIAVILVAAFAVGCGSSSKQQTSSSAAGASFTVGAAESHLVTLSLVGGAGNVNTVACGKQEPFEDYSTPAQVRYTGNVTPAPSGRFKVKVKLKRCNGTSFVDTRSQKVVGQPGGRFDGVVDITTPGAYSLRAGLEPADTPQSQKLYFQVR